MGSWYPRTPRNLLNHTLFVLNFLTLDSKSCSAADGFWNPQSHSRHPEVLWRDPLTNQWHGPDPVLMWGGGYVCVYPTDTDNPRWIPERCVKHAPDRKIRRDL